MEKAAGKLRNGKSTGDDRIVSELLKDGGEATINCLWELLQIVWRIMQVPSEWKSTTLEPLHKKKDRTLFEGLQSIIEPQLWTPSVVSERDAARSTKYG